MDEVRGVRLGDVYRDQTGALWEVRGLVTDPMAMVVRVEDGKSEHHVIGCPIWMNKWMAGPLREDVPDE